MTATTDPAISTIDAYIQDKKVDTSVKGWRTSLPSPPAVSFDAGTTYHWVLRTNHGEVRIKLLSADAPKHVASTIYLTRLGFYDGLSFHRVIDGFMAQGGCPLGTGTGGPGFRMNGEFGGATRHDRRGILSMANAGPGTDGSQFFLTFVPTPHLDGKHTVFGVVDGGLETLDALESRGSRSGATTEPLGIESAEIVAS